MRHTDRQPYRITVTREETGDTADHKVSSTCAMRVLELVSRDQLGVLLAPPEGPHERVAADLERRADLARERAGEAPDEQGEAEVRLLGERYAFAAAVLRDLANTEVEVAG